MSLPYTIIDFEQGTSKWLHWRHEGIGASDAATVMGENPWKDAYESACLHSELQIRLVARQR